MSAVGKIGSALGGVIKLWFVPEVWGTGSDRGEEGEYHHCDNLRRSKRGGSSGGNLESKPVLVCD
jgi:hypothetical protein